MPKNMRLSKSTLVGNVSYHQLNRIITKLNAVNGLLTTIGANNYYVPASMLEVGTPAEITLASAAADTLTLGTTNACTGNTVVARLPDVGTATLQRKTCIINGSTGAVDVTWADEGNTTINGQAKRITIAEGGYVVLEEKANDDLIIYEGDKVSLEAFVSSASASISSSASSSISSSASASISSSISSSISASASISSSVSASISSSVSPS